MKGHEPPLVADPRAVTADWLTDVLRFSGAIDEATTVSRLAATPVGTGQVGAIVRFEMDYVEGSGPATLICKFASPDPESASIGVLTRTYETEVHFYTELAHTVDIARPRCHFAAVEPGTPNVVVVLDDLSPAVQGDQIAGCSVEQAALAVEQAAHLHGPRWADPDLAQQAWLARPTSLYAFEGLRAIWEAFVARYETMLEAVTIEQGERMLLAGAGLARIAPKALTVVHNDFRLDNMLFADAAEGPPITVVDWQTVGVGRGPADIAYFLGSSFPDPTTRRECEQRLVAAYHEALLAYDVPNYSVEECWDEYRLSSFGSLAMAVFASMHVGRTERGDRMFMAMANRSAQLAADTEAASLAT
jgi:hypothetical protein